MINRGFISQDKYEFIKNLVPIVCVDVAIEHRGKILLVKRRDEPAAGEWWLPGGRLFRGEGLRACALRKAKEETGLNCWGVVMIYYASTVFETIHSVNFVYLMFAESDRVELDETCLDYKWVDTVNDNYHEYVKAALGRVLLNLW